MCREGHVHTHRLPWVEHGKPLKRHCCQSTSSIPMADTNDDMDVDIVSLQSIATTC